MTESKLAMPAALMKKECGTRGRQFERHMRNFAWSPSVIFFWFAITVARAEKSRADLIFSGVGPRIPRFSLLQLVEFDTWKAR